MASPGKFDSSSTIPLWLDGKEVTTSTTFDVISPLDQTTICKSSSASDDDVQAAIAAAEKALPAWSQTKPNVRRDILLRAADDLSKRKDEMFHYSNSNTGAARSMFDFDFQLTVNALKDVAGLIGAVQGSIPTTMDEGRTALQVR